MIKWINELNTTSFRIIATVGIIYMTATRYLLSGVTIGGVKFDTLIPHWMWLLFIWGLAGVEGAVLIAKRLSDYEYRRIIANAKPPTEITAQTANVDATSVSVEAEEVKSK